MARFYNISPDYFQSAPELRAMLMEADAALLIGDDALRARYKNQDRLFIYDLGSEWKKFTGLPMVFAVWAIRRDFAQNRRDELKLIRDTFTDSIRFSLENIEHCAAKASQWEDFTADYLIDYFNNLRFDFDESKQEGLLQYYKEAKNQGLIDVVPPIEIMDI